MTWLLLTEQLLYPALWPRWYHTSCLSSPKWIIRIPVGGRVCGSTKPVSHLTFLGEIPSSPYPREIMLLFESFFSSWNGFGRAVTVSLDLSSRCTRQPPGIKAATDMLWLWLKGKRTWPSRERLSFPSELCFKATGVRRSLIHLPYPSSLQAPHQRTNRLL